MTDTLILRDATEADLVVITDIYAWNTLNGTGTFALDVVPYDEMLAYYRNVRSMGLPYLVAVENDIVVGYAYAAPFRARPGYRYGVEDSIYLAPGQGGRGLGKALLNQLIELCIARGLYTMIAVIGDGANQASIGVHRACGFAQTGSLPRAGFKFGRWLDVVFMTRDLLPQTDTPEGGGWAP